MDGRLKAGPKEFASSRSGALCFLCPVCFNIVQKSGNWASGKLRTVGEPSKYCTRLEKMAHRNWGKLSWQRAFYLQAYCRNESQS